MKHTPTAAAALDDQPQLGRAAQPQKIDITKSKKPRFSWLLPVFLACYRASLMGNNLVFVVAQP